MAVGGDDLLVFAAAPAAASALGGVVALVRPLGAQAAAAAQLFTAGLIFAAVAVELLPQLNEQRPAVVAAGFAVGTAAMLVLRRQTRRLEAASETGGGAGVVSALAVDTAVDGLLLGVAFATGAEEGVVLAVALGLEALFLNLSATVAVQAAGAPRQRVLATTGSFAALLAVSATVGLFVFSALPEGLYAAAVAFGVAALLYSVTEELLVEAHEEDEPPHVTAAFFVGFLLVLLFELG